MEPPQYLENDTIMPDKAELDNMAAAFQELRTCKEIFGGVC